jgi:hypothetical protein
MAKIVSCGLNPSLSKLVGRFPGLAREHARPFPIQLPAGFMDVLQSMNKARDFRKTRRSSIQVLGLTNHPECNIDVLQAEDGYR